MRVLVTNAALESWTGSELYVRDLAGGLRARGHLPLLYSPNLGALAEGLRRDGLTVVDDLGRLPAPPDLIHGQHHLETIAALLHFPAVPAVFFGHGILPWEEAPPRHPRILRYVATGPKVAAHIAGQAGVPARDVEIIRSFVDCARFAPRGPLPPRPSRALVLSNYLDETELLPAVRRACGRLGICVDLIGARAGNSTPSPEMVLGSYDVVFAIGRCALEAMAVGAAVILCHAEGLGGMVTPASFAAPDNGDVGRGALTRPVTVEGLEAELRAYDPASVSAVREIVRSRRSLELALDRCLVVYERALAAFAGPLPPAQERAALHDYQRWLSRAIRLELVGPLMEERRAAAKRQAAAELELAALAQRVRELEGFPARRVARLLGGLPGLPALRRGVRRLLPRLRR